MMAFQTVLLGRTVTAIDSPTSYEGPFNGLEGPNALLGVGGGRSYVNGFPARAV